MRLLHELAKIHATFDDPHLVSHAGLVPVMALAQRAGLGDLAAEHVRIAQPCGVNAPVKIACLVAGMAAGADSIDDMDLLRHGAMPVLFGELRAPSTLGSFLRSFTWGNVLQLQKVHRQFLAELARRAPLLPGADVLAFVDIDSQQKRVYGHAKQGAAFGFTKIQGKGLLVRGLNVLAATICTPLAAPVIAGTRLRGGNAASARGAASMITEAVSTARAAGCTGTLVVRMDSAFYGAPAVTGGPHRPERASPSPCAWTRRSAPRSPPSPRTPGSPIRYPRAIWDDQLGRWVSDAQVAEVRIHRLHLPQGAGDHRPADRPPRQGPQPQGGRRAGRAVHRLALPRRLHRLAVRPSRPRSTTAATPRPSRSSPTGPTARSRTCPRAPSPPTPPGSRSPPSAATCCAPPEPWPASPTPKPAAPPCAATSSTSPPAPPATAAATSPCTCPKAGTASTNG